MGSSSSQLHPAATFDTNTTCDECNSTEFDRGADGAWYCKECGTVCSAPPVEQSEPHWRPQTDRRTGPPSSKTRVSVGSRIGDGNSFDRPRWSDLNNRLSQQRDTLRHGLKEVRAVAVGLGVPPATREHAGHLFRRAANAGHLQGQSIEAVSAACVCAAGKNFEPQLTFAWVSEVSPVEKDRITTAYRKLVSDFELPVEPATPTGVLPRTADRVGVSVTERERAQTLLETVEAKDVHIGQSPPGLAAAAVYIAAEENDRDLTQVEVAEAACVSSATLSRQRRRIEGVIDE